MNTPSARGTAAMNEPRTEAGRALLGQWMDLKETHHPNTALVRDTILAIEAQAAHAATERAASEGLPFDVDEFVRFHVNERGYIHMAGDDLTYALRAELRAALAAAPPVSRWPEATPENVEALAKVLELEALPRGLAGGLPASRILTALREREGRAG